MYFSIHMKKILKSVFRIKHHTHSYAHIIKKFNTERINSERVTIFFKKCGDLQQALVKYYIYSILIPINLDWVTISCFKNVEIVRDRYKM